MSWPAIIFLVLAALAMLAICAGARRIAAKLDRAQRASWPFVEGDEA